MTKLHRLSQRLQFPFEINNKIFKLISEIDALSREFQITEKLSPQTIKRLTKSVLVTSTGSSNRIEWNKLSNEEVESLYSHMNIKKFKTRDEQEVAGYLEILSMVFESYPDINFSEWVILQLHEMMLKHVEKDIGHRGKYKFWPNRVEARDYKGNLVKVVFNPTEPALTPIEMRALIDWAKQAFKEKAIHPLLIIANFIFEFLAIHPFQDGNGRTSRVLTNLLLLKNGYLFTPFVSHESLIESKKVEYYKVLAKTQQTWKTKHEDMSAWILFFLEILKKQVSKAIELSHTDNIEIHLSDIQNKVWNIILANNDISRQEIQKKTGLSDSTIKQVINKLIHMKKIERIGETRSVKYRVL